MKGLLILTLLFFCISVKTFSQCTSGSTATLATSGNWGGGPPQATWNYTGGITDPSQACQIIIPAGLSLSIQSNTTWYGSVEVNGTLNLDNQLNLGTGTVPSGCGLTVRIYNAGLVSGAGSSDRLIICGQTVVSGQPNPPAGAVDWPADGSFSAGDIGGSGGGFGVGGLLPIKLVYFKASIPHGENRTLVEWATEKEDGFDHFEIERAAADSKFSKIGEVMGVGYNTNSLQKYSFIDENPLVGHNYYRLKAVDLDGSYETFHIVFVTFADVKRFSVFPNPAIGADMKYRINFEYSSGDKIILFDKLGKEIQNGSVSGVENSLPFSEEVKPGVYLVKYVSPSFTDIVKIIVR
jgi:hypothetical protein